ncbi:tyrosine-type recombinase/integrase [Prauserella cavernicola]|uniref:Tyrosine-type recombinase/integrase n=1 Tax=Prauserella cavernicola TaxID=2800127 RepID=A0A934QUK4_9PSEU|nr:tyrosine-type recombinase/integrase [Prauserella cavernicola]MBK1786586.1 tyrosine-type recombinase/integrase [Prauserella cavernicola]
MPLSHEKSSRQHSSQELIHWPATTGRWGLAPGQPDDLVFVTRTGRVVEPRNVNTMLDRVVRHAKIDRSRVHDLRHTCATLLLLDGATIRDVMDQLGHASVTTTGNIYGHVLDEAKQKMAERMNRLAEGD